MPSHVSVLEKMSASGVLPEGKSLVPMLKGSKPVFREGAPAWYPQFSNAVYTNLHAAATGSITVDAGDQDDQRHGEPSVLGS